MNVQKFYWTYSGVYSVGTIRVDSKGRLVRAHCVDQSADGGWMTTWEVLFWEA